MSRRSLRFAPCSRWISIAALAWGCQAGAAPAQRAPGLADRLHAQAVTSFRQARFAEAYGRFIGLADAGHAPSAEVALWMYLNGPTLFGREWDSTPEQLAAWAALARQPAPVMTASRSSIELVRTSARGR